MGFPAKVERVEPQEMGPSQDWIVPSPFTDVNRGRKADEAFCAVVQTHKRRSNKIYKTELTKIKI